MNALVHVESKRGWRLRVIEPKCSPLSTLYLPISANASDTVFIADCGGDPLIPEIFARTLAAEGDPAGAFAWLNGWLLRGGVGRRAARALYASFLSAGLIRLWWAGYCGMYIRERDGVITTRQCPAAALGTVPGVSCRETLMRLGRGETMLLPNAALERLFRMGAITRRAIFARESLADGLNSEGCADGVPSALAIERPLFSAGTERHADRIDIRYEVGCAF